MALTLKTRPAHQNMALRLITHNVQFAHVCSLLNFSASIRRNLYAYHRHDPTIRDPDYARTLSTH